MKTLRLKVTPEDLNSDTTRHAIETAADILRGGGLVAFPTETVYGLGANALDAHAVEKIFEAKQRPSWDPLIVHISDRAMLASVATGASFAEPLATSANKLISAFWPGPLTLLLPKAETVPLIVTAGRPLVGVRMPSHPVAKALIAAAGVPIAAPSANRFGRISPTCADHVLEDLDGRIDAVLDAGETDHGLESTVVDASQEPVVLYRPGIISLDKIRDVCGAAVQWKSGDTGHPDRELPPESMPSPGLGIRHYAPRATLVLVAGAPGEQPAALLHAVAQAAQEQKSIGIMLPANFLPEALSPKILGKAAIFRLGRLGRLCRAGASLVRRPAPTRRRRSRCDSLPAPACRGSRPRHPGPADEGCEEAIASDSVLLVFARLIQIFDARLIDQRASAMADLDHVAVVPFDDPFDRLAIIQHDGHLRLRLDLLLEVKDLGVRTLLPDLIGALGGVVGSQRGDASSAPTSGPSYP